MGQTPGGPRKPSRAEKEAAVEWVNRLKAAAASASDDLWIVRERVQGEFNRWISGSPTRLPTFIDAAYSCGWLRERESDLIGMVVEGTDPRGTLKWLNVRNGRITMSDQWVPVGPLSQGAGQSVTMRALVFAGIFVTIALGGLTLWDRTSGASYRTLTREHRRVPLEDGSVVFLDEASEIRVSFSRARREIELVRGQALFDVKHDRSRPMLVTSGTAEVDVMGTAFDIVQRQGHTGVAVVNGTVRVHGTTDTFPWGSLFEDHSSSTPRSSRTGALTLSGGEYAEVEGKEIIRSGQADLQNMLAWHSVNMPFNDQRLAVVAEQLNRNSIRQLRIGPIARERRISGTYVTDRPEMLVSALQRLYPDLVVQETGDGWVVEVAQKR